MKIYKFLLILVMVAGTHFAFGYYISINGGASRACPNTISTYYLITDVSPATQLILGGSNCQVEYPYLSNSWYSTLYLGYGNYNGFTFRVKFGTSGTSASLSVYEYYSGGQVSSGRSIDLGAPAGNPGYITGSDLILNCSGYAECKSYTPNGYTGWSLDHWSHSGYIDYCGAGSSTSNPTYVHGTNTYYQGMQTLTATFAYHDPQGNACGTRDISKNIWLNTPSTPSSITIQMDAPPNRFTATVNGGEGATSWNWYKDYVEQASHDISVICTRTSPYCGHSYYVEVEAVNDCGISSKIHKTAIEPDCGDGFIYFPNPADQELTVEAVDSQTGKFQESKVIDFIIEIYDENQYLLKEGYSDKNKAVIDVSDLKPGTYFLHIIENNVVYKKQLLIE